VNSLKRIGILPCSGACNVGMLSTKAVVEILGERDNTDFVCALGLPLGIESIINNGKSSDGYIALNGCPVRCATKSLESADIPINEEVIITEKFNIKKNKNLKSDEKIDQILDELKRLIDKIEKE
jgi:uncharacterized metal-binding protein